MKLSQSAAYAIHAVLLLAEAEVDDPVSCADLAKRGAMPHRFLLQILRDLAKKGIVRPTRGGGGGFALERSPSEITLLEVIEAIDGPLVSGRISLGSLHPEIVQRVRDALARASDVCRGVLQSTCLNDLLPPPNVVDGTAGPEPA